MSPTRTATMRTAKSATPVAEPVRRSQRTRSKPAVMSALHESEATSAPTRNGTKRTAEATKAPVTKRTKRASSAEDVVTETLDPLASLSEEVLMRMAAYMNVADVLSFTSALKSVRATASNTFWENILVEQCGVPAAKIKPRMPRREQVVKFAQSKGCRHCKMVSLQNKQIRKHSEYRGWVVCGECLKLPRFQEIGYQEAMNKFGLKHFELAQLPFRTITMSVHHDYDSDFETYTKKLLNLEKVLSFVESLKAAETCSISDEVDDAQDRCRICRHVGVGCTAARLPNESRRSWLCSQCIKSTKIQEIGYMQAMKDFKLKRAQILQIPCRLVEVNYHGHISMKKLYNVQTVIDFVES